MVFCLATSPFDYVLGGKKVSMSIILGVAMYKDFLIVGSTSFVKMKSSATVIFSKIYLATAQLNKSTAQFFVLFIDTPIC